MCSLIHIFAAVSVIQLYHGLCPHIRATAFYALLHISMSAAADMLYELLFFTQFSSNSEPYSRTFGPPRAKLRERLRTPTPGP